MSQGIVNYLEAFTEKARSAGLDMARPGKNWAPMKPIVPGSHISLSVRRDRIQVNLNNDKDVDRSRFDSLYADREAIERAIGLGLDWERKEGTKKTSVRATYHAGYESPDWSDQHEWALETMKAFKEEFSTRLSRFE